MTGWWLTYPSEKYEFVSWDDFPFSIYYMESHKFMFQTTNQKLSINHPISIAFHSYVSLPAGNHHVGWGPDDHLMVVPQETHHFLVLMGQSPTAAAPRCAQGASAASPWPGAPGASASWPPRCRWRRGRSAVFGVSHGGSRGAFIGAGNPEFMMNYLLVLNAGNEGMIHNH